MNISHMVIFYSYSALQYVIVATYRSKIILTKYLMLCVVIFVHTKHITLVHVLCVSPGIKRINLSH